MEGDRTSEMEVGSQSGQGVAPRGLAGEGRRGEEAAHERARGGRGGQTTGDAGHEQRTKRRRGER
jgi:hypothetical protein